LKDVRNGQLYFPFNHHLSARLHHLSPCLDSLNSFATQSLAGDWGIPQLRIMCSTFTAPTCNFLLASSPWPQLPLPLCNYVAGNTAHSPNPAKLAS